MLVRVPDRHAPLLELVRRSVLDGPGTVDGAVRRAAAERGDVPAPLVALVDRIHDAAYDVTDADLASAKAAGFDDDALFEITVAAAIGAASHRCARAIAALESEEPS